MIVACSEQSFAVVSHLDLKECERGGPGCSQSCLKHCVSRLLPKKKKNMTRNACAPKTQALPNPSNHANCRRIALRKVACYSINLALAAEKHHKLVWCRKTIATNMQKTREKKDARDTHACCGVVATYQNREGVRLAPGRRAHTAARHWTAAGHW